ncbi:hypothetical protein V1520DRAFT_332383, partial [Lipomyces starkeyi]
MRRLFRISWCSAIAAFAATCTVPSTASQGRYDKTMLLRSFDASFDASFVKSHQKFAGGYPALYVDLRDSCLSYLRIQVHIYA